MEAVFDEMFCVGFLWLLFCLSRVAGGVGAFTFS
jgi:hypothetical protein